MSENGSDRDDEDAAGLSEEDRQLLARMQEDSDRAWREHAAAGSPDVEGGLPDEKQDFPIGIRPDGTVNHGEPRPGRPD